LESSKRFNAKIYSYPTLVSILAGVSQGVEIEEAAVSVQSGSLATCYFPATNNSTNCASTTNDIIADGGLILGRTKPQSDTTLDALTLAAIKLNSFSQFVSLPFDGHPLTPWQKTIVSFFW